MWRSAPGWCGLWSAARSPRARSRHWRHRAGAGMHSGDRARTCCDEATVACTATDVDTRQALADRAKHAMGCGTAREQVRCHCGMTAWQHGTLASSQHAHGHSLWESQHGSGDRASRSATLAAQHRRSTAPGLRHLRGPYACTHACICVPRCPGWGQNTGSTPPWR